MSVINSSILLILIVLFYNFTAAAENDIHTINNSLSNSRNRTSTIQGFKNLSIHRLFTASITYTGSPSICVGGNIILTADNPPVGSTFIWLKDSSPIPGAISSTYVATQAGDYSVKISTSGVDEVSPVVTVTVNPLPDGSFTFTNNNTVSGTIIQFNSSTSSGTPPFSYEWNFGDGQTSTAANPTHAYSSVGCSNQSYNISLKLTDAKGCSKTITSQSINVLHKPDVTVADVNLFSPFSNCVNSPTAANPNYTLTISNTSPSAACITSYTLDWGDGTIQNGLTGASFPLTHTYTQLGAFDLKVTATGSNGSTNSKVYVVANQTNPAGGLGTLGSTTGLCAPASVPFVVSNWQNNSPGTIYIMQYGDGTSETFTHPLNATNTDQTFNHIYTTSSCPISSFTATLIVKNACDETPYTAGNIQVRIQPSANFTIPASTCEGQSICFPNTTVEGTYGSCSSLTTYSWNFGDNSSSSNTAVTKSACHTFSAPGTYTVTLTASNPCGTTTKTQIVVVNPLPVMTNPLIATTCSGATVNIPLTSDIPATFKWVAVSNANVTGESTTQKTSNIISDVLVNTSAVAQNITYTVTPVSTTGSCIGTSQNVIVTVNPRPVNLVVTSTINYCIGETASALTATALSGHTLNWYSTSTGGTASSSAPTPSTLATGTINYYVSQTSTSTGCESARAIISVKVNPIPAAPVANTSITYCQGKTTTALTATATTGNTLKWYNDPTGGIALSSAPVPNSSVVGPINYYVSQISNFGCEGPRTAITVTIYSTPSAPAIPSPIIFYCQGETASILTATTDPGNTLKWYTVASGGTASGTAPTPNTTVPGLVNYYVSQATASCEGPRSNIKVQVNGLPSAPSVTSSINYCLGDPAAPLSAIATVSGNTLKWYTVPSGGTADLNSPTPSTGIAGTEYYYVSQTSADACEGPRAAITVNTAAPLTITGPQFTHPGTCNGSNGIITLSGLPANISFSVSFKKNGLADSRIITSNITGDLAIGNLTAGTYTDITVQLSSCSATVSGPFVLADPAPPAMPTLGGNTVLCGGETLNLTSTSAGAGATYQWTGPNSFSSNLQNPSRANVIAAYTGIYTLTITQNNCTATQTIAVTVNPNPVLSSTLSPPAICTNTLFNYTPASLVSGTTFTWSRAASAGITNPAASGTDNPAEILINNTNSPVKVSYSYTLAANACSTTQIVNVTVNPALNNLINNSPFTICAGQLVAVPGSPATGGTGVYQYSWESSADNLSWSIIPNQNARDLTISLPNTAYIRRIVSSGPCSSESSSVLITVQPAIADNSILGIQSVCTGKPVPPLTGSTPTGADNNFFYKWQSSTNEITWFDIPGETAKDFQPPVLTETTYYRRMVSSNLCAGLQQNESNSIRVTVYPNAKAEFTASSTRGCIPFNLAQAISVVAYADRNATYEWFANGLSIGTGSAFPGHTINTDGQTVTVKLVTTSKFGCESDSKEINFSTVKTVDATFTKDINQGCGPVNVNFTNTTVTTPGIQYEWNFGNGTTSSITQPGTITFNPHPQNRDTTYIITLRAYTDCRENIYTDSVLVRPKPVAIFSPSVTMGCSPLKINFTNQSRGAPATYTFDFGNGDKVVKTDKLAFDYTFITTKADTFTVKLYTTNECGTDSASYDIIVLPNSVIPELVVRGTAFGCAPFTVNFDNNSIGGSSFTWNFGDGSTVVSNSSPEMKSHTFSTPGIYTVTLFATNGCSNAQTTEIITVYAPPSANFSTDKSQYCVSEVVKFENQSELNTSYLWDFEDGTTSNQANPEHIFNIAKDYQVKLTVIKTFADGSNCSKTVAYPVKVLALPTVSISSNTSTENCAPFTLSATANSSNSSAVEWNFGDINSSVNTQTGLAAKHTFENAGTYRVIAKSFNLAGCIDSSIVIIKVTESPVALFSSSSTSVCGISGTLTFKNQTTFPTGTSISYKWQVNTTDVSTSANLTHTFNVPSGAPLPYQYQVKLIAFNSNGCTDTTTQTIQFNPLPKADYTVNAASGCPPFKVNIQNKSVYSDQYNWYINNKLVSTGSIPEIILEDPNTIYTLKLVTANFYGCSKDSISRTITTLPKPSAAFQVQDSIGCNGKLDLKTTNNSSGASSFIWDFGDGSALQSGLAPAHTYGRTGTFILKLIASNGICTDTAFTQIKIAATPQAGFIAPNTSACTSLKVAFQNISENTSTYLWDFGDGTYSTEKNPVHNYTYIKSPYSVTLVAFGQFGCIDTLEIKNYITVTAPPTANFETLPDSVIKIPDFTFGFRNQSMGSPVKFRWNFGDGKLSQEENPSHTYVAVGKYAVTLIVFNAQGCADTVMRMVEVLDVPGKLYVPNAFEPGNVNGKINVFKPTGTGMTKYSLRIFNKWGQMIWQTDKINELGEPIDAWDGKLNGQDLPQGVYLWDISASFINGTEWKGMKYEKGPTRKSGPIHLIR